MPLDVALDPTTPQVRETHSGLVLLIGDRAYKLKKPVRLGFLDFGTRERRLAVCRREVELNRRLAPDVYLGVADVSGVDGRPCEHLVVMRRMPESRRLSTMVRAGEPMRDAIVEIARRIAVFHASADRSPEITEQGGRDALRQRWRDGFAQVEPFRGTVLDSVHLTETVDLVERFLAGREPLFAARARDGRIVDGHGDLLADDIFCLDDGPRVLDCLEFDDRLRWLDGLDDIAFLAMDLERLGAPELRDLLLDRYAEFAGDPAPPALRHHYLAYRAFVRAKVACLRHSQHDPDAAHRAGRDAVVALEHLRAGRVRLILVGGLPGTGKTTLAGLLADHLGATLLSSDRLRKELAGIDPAVAAPAVYEDGIYRSEHTERVYAELLRRAETLLALGETVVLDASWHDARHRALAAAVASRTDSSLVALRCTAPTDLAAARLRERVGGCSDADPAIAAAMATDEDPWPDAVPISTDGPEPAALSHALRAMNRGELS